MPSPEAGCRLLERRYRERGKGGKGEGRGRSYFSFGIIFNFFFLKICDSSSKWRYFYCG